MHPLHFNDGHIIAITGKLGGNSVPQGFSTEEEYLQALVSFYTKAAVKSIVIRELFGRTLARIKETKQVCACYLHNCK